MKINKKELIVGNTAYVVTKKYDSDQMKQVYHIVPAEIKKVGRKYITVTVQYWDQEFCLKDDGVIYEFALNNKQMEQITYCAYLKKMQKSIF